VRFAYLVLDARVQTIGKQGITLTPLKPYGNASIETQILEVKARHGFIPEETRVVIRAMDGKTPIVEPHP
jgi:membrane-bound ClpP family serine protease